MTRPCNPYCCAKGCCGCILFLPWLLLVCLTFYGLSNQPSFCHQGVSPEKAAHDARPDVYKEDGSVNWASVESGWNKACGEAPANFTEFAASYADETGGLALVEDASAFKINAWSEAGGNFKIFKVRDVTAVDNYPFGSRPQTVRNVAMTFDVNLFWMPTATKEFVGYTILQYEVCAYFRPSNGSLPTIRLYKTTESPLGATEPFVQVFVEAKGDPKLFKYDVVLEGYNDNPPGVGKAQFSSLETTECSIWSTAPGNNGVRVLIIVLTILLVVYVAGLMILKQKARKAESGGQTSPSTQAA